MRDNVRACTIGSWAASNHFSVPVQCQQQIKFHQSHIVSLFVISLAQHGISWQQSRLLLIHFEGYFHLVFEYIRVLLGTAKIALIVVLRTCIIFRLFPFFASEKFKFLASKKRE